MVAWIAVAVIASLHPALAAGQTTPQAAPPQTLFTNVHDILIVDRNPLDDISLLSDLEKNLKVIMKDGKIFKNTLEESRTVKR